MVNPPLPEQLKTNTLVGFLDGEARDLIDEMPDSDKNQYCKIVEQLRGHFESPHFRSLARQQLSDCKQGQSESAREFADRIKQIVQKQLIHYLSTRRIVKAITYESLLADAANAITIFPPVQAPTPVVHAVQAQRGNFRGPAQYYQRRPNFANRQLSASPHQGSNFNRRAAERASSDATYDLPPANLAPPRPFYRTGNRRPINSALRQQQGPWSGRRPLDNQRWNNNNQVQLTNPSIFRQPASRSQPKVFALEPTDDTTPVNDGSEPLSDQQKDAHIAALIERNSALANLAFATSDLNLQDEPCECPEWHKQESIYFGKLGIFMCARARYMLTNFGHTQNMRIRRQFSRTMVRTLSKTLLVHWRTAHIIRASVIWSSRYLDPGRAGNFSPSIVVILSLSPIRAMPLGLCPFSARNEPLAPPFANKSVSRPPTNWQPQAFGS
ncbi:hypothetical protein OSTOST_02792 [Ostertagia ostertagi]